MTISPLAPNYVNVAGVDASGVEGEAAFTIAGGLRARLTYTYTRTRVMNAGFDTGEGATFVRGEPLIRRPTHVARAEVGRTIASRAEVVLGAAYTGESHDRDYSAWPAAPVVLGARTLFDVAASVRLSAPGARVPLHARLRADNATDVEYQGIFGFRAPGRSVRIGVTIGRP